VFNTVAKDELKQYLQEHEAPRSKMHQGTQLNTSVTFDNKVFLKVYRKVDPGVNPDAEISRYLSDDAGFKNTPPFLGVLEWKMERETVVLAMAEAMVENHGDGRSFMLERINNYIERILARDRNVTFNYPRLGSLIHPVSHESLPEELREFLGGSAADQARLMGSRTAELHRALANGNEKDFRPEEFSLHYQRSLFSAMQSLVRETYQSLSRKIDSLPADLQPAARELAGRKNEMLERLKRIYTKKFDVVKTRIHGFYGLDEILLTGKDVMIHNFNGNPLRSFSERRLKRSPLRDIAAMVRSFYYVAYEGFFMNTQVRKEELQELLPLADFWAFYMSSFFIKSYCDHLGENNFIPKDPEDMEIIMQTYILEHALHYLNYELNYRPDRTMVPLNLIESVFKKETKPAGA
jgi:maltose alpha-D-glucosyltransferase/alpha-amylase